MMMMPRIIGCDCAASLLRFVGAAPLLFHYRPCERCDADDAGAAAAFSSSVVAVRVPRARVAAKLAAQTSLSPAGRHPRGDQASNKIKTEDVVDVEGRRICAPSLLAGFGVIPVYTVRNVGQSAANLTNCKNRFYCTGTWLSALSNTTVPFVRFKPRFSAVSTGTSCPRKASLVLRKVAESLRFDCGQCGSHAVFAVSCGSLHLQNRREQRLEPHSGKVVWYSAHKSLQC